MSRPRVAPLFLSVRDYALSPTLQQKLDELDSLHCRRQLLPSAPRARSVVLVTVSQLCLLLRRRLAAAFYAIRHKATVDVRRVPIGKIVTMTACERCGAAGLTLLTTGRDSPRFRGKLELLLPDDEESVGDTRSWEVPRATRSRPLFASVEFLGDRLKRLQRRRLLSAFECLYAGQKCAQFGKDPSLTFEFVSETDLDAGDKIYNISRIEPHSETKPQEDSFASEDHILTSIEADSDPLLMASYSAATILLFSRLEKAVERRCGECFQRLSRN